MVNVFIRIKFHNTKHKRFQRVYINVWNFSRQHFEILEDNLKRCQTTFLRKIRKILSGFVCWILQRVLKVNISHNTPSNYYKKYIYFYIWHLLSKSRLISFCVIQNFLLNPICMLLLLLHYYLVHICTRQSYEYRCKCNPVRWLVTSDFNFLFGVINQKPQVTGQGYKFLNIYRSNILTSLWSLHLILKDTFTIRLKYDIQGPVVQS